jgi:hypothetical protein
MLGLAYNNELLLDQIPKLEHLIQLAVDKRIPTDDPRSYLSKFKKHEDIFQVLSAGRNNTPYSEPSLRCQYDVLTGRAGASVLGSLTACEISAQLLWLMQHVMPGRSFFVTKMGFFGVAVTRSRKNDCVTFVFGQKLPMILWPRGSSYCMVGAASVSGVMHDEVTGDMYENGLVEERTFLIR